jgi:CRP/FNR family transcriptional regulator
MTRSATANRATLESALREQIPFAPQLTPQGLERLAQAVEARSFPSGARVLEEGQPCPALLLVRTGHLRVFKTSASGREITLYRVRPGDACALGMSCVLSGSGYPAHLEAPVDCEVWAVPAAVVRQLYASEPSVQRLVVDHLAFLVQEMMTLVAEVAFRRMDQRLAGFLLDEAARTGGVVQGSHEELALHLGTAREVVSRLLENFKDDGWISVERRQVRIVQNDALERLRGDVPTAL